MRNANAWRLGSILRSWTGLFLFVAAPALLYAQTPPTISSIPDQGVYPNCTSRPIAFVIGDAETPPTQLTVAGSSSNTNIVPNSGLVFGGSQNNRTLTVIPTLNQTGMVNITITVTDKSGLSASNSFAFDVAYFTAVPSSLPALGEGHAVWGDYDNDGRLDLLMTGEGTNSNLAFVFHNNGDGTFTDLNAGLTAGWRSTVAWVDYNQDGRLDALVTGDVPHLYRNDGGGVFTLVQPGLPLIQEGGGPGAIAWGDYDNDGRPDLALAGQSTNLTRSTFVYHNNGDGSFSSAQFGLPGTTEGSLDWGDFDNDGDLDLVVSGNGPGFVQTIKVFRNNGQGGLTEAATNFPAVWLSTTHWGDYDNDGDLDLLVTGGFGDGNAVSRIYRNDGGAFTDINAGLAGVWFSQSAWVDFDNDGNLDVILGGRDSSGATVTHLYRNNGNGTFTEVNAGLTNIQSGSYAWGDFDNDGDLDLLVIGLNCDFGCPVVQLYRNNAPANTPPTAPGGLNVTLLPGNDVALRWNTATDAQTPSKGLTYDLRVGTNAGGFQVSAPPADLATGFRRLPQPGTAHTNAWRLVDLAKGTYTWSVQAVDSALAGSPFSAEGTFTITNSRPVITSPGPQTTFPNVALSNLGFTVGDEETSAAALVVTASSGNTNLLPNANILLGGSGANRTVTLRPVGNRGGDSVVTLTVTDSGGLTRTAQFTLHVEAFTGLTSVFPPLPPAQLLRSQVSRAWVDFDNDGALDVLFVRETENINFYQVYDTTLILRNDGSGGFTPMEVGLTNIYTRRAAWGDVDNDGRADLLMVGSTGVGNSFSNFTRLYHNNGTSLEALPVQLPALNGSALAIADINGDGYMDLFIAGTLVTPYDTQTTQIYAGDGHGSFREWANDLPLFNLYNLECQWVDLDNDGDLDLLLADGRLFRNDGGGHFTDLSNRVPNPQLSLTLDCADLDNDGDLDLLVAGTTNAVCRNNGDATFALVASGITNRLYMTSMVLADYDNDGAVDVLLSDSGGLLFHNDGTGSFSLAQTNFPIGLWGDYNNDGKLDLLVDGVIYRNNTATANTPPTAPFALRARELPGSSIEFTWARPTDAQTAKAAGLSYNLRVGTTANGIDVFSPLADPTTGLRRLPQRGNAGSTNRWVLRDLPRGTYYWSVQAIDGAFAGSPFATNATFTVTRPVLSNLPDLVVAPGIQPPPIAFTVWDGETAAGDLTLSVSCSNTNLVAFTNLVLGGSGTNRTLALTPTPGQVGTNLVTLTVTDGDGFTDSKTFQFIVEPFLPVGGLSFGTTSRVYPADYNNDGLMDILVTGDPVQLWRNLGNGTFTNDATGLPTAIIGTAAWGDYDNDGWLDLAFSGTTNIYHNDGSNNHFTAVPGPLKAPSFYGTGDLISWGDYDGDGKLDLMRLSWMNVQLFRNLGNGLFTNSNITLQWGQVGSIGWADLNNDGKLDLVVSGDFTGGGSFFTYIYRGDGTNLTLVVSNSLVGVRWSSVAFRDFDGDGDLDILLAGDRTSAGNQTCRIYRNDGNFKFTDLGEVGPAGTIRNAAWGDYNNDGRPDVLAYGVQSTTVFLNNGDGTFSNIQAGLPTVGVGGAAWADFDNDGDLDIVADRLYANTRPFTNQPPLAPTRLAANFASNVVVLAWNAPVDDTTASKALTYSVRLGTNSGGSQILAPDADPVTGCRRLVPEVNAWPNPFRLISSLPDGNYFWSVQAIDAGYAGSPFAPEASFSYFHPTITGPTNVVTYAAAPSALVPLLVGDADSPADSLVLSAFVSNPNLLTPANIVFGGTGSNRTALLTLLPGTVGTSLVSVVVMDVTGLKATNTFYFESSYFTDVAAVFSGSNYFNAHWADFDNDNRLDLFYGGFLYHNEGDGNFTLTASPGPANRNGVAWGDYDRDGYQDFAWADGTTLKIFHNNGGGVFVATGQSFALSGTAALAWGDYDNDGDLDLAVSQPGASRIYRNDHGVFTLAVANLPPCSDGAVAWGDFDNDGDQDLLIAGLGYGPLDWRAEIYRNDGNGVFTPIGAGLYGVDHASVAWGDVDNDGLLDLLITGFNYGSYVLQVYHNNGNGTFTDLNVGLQGVAYSDAGFGDFDNDGWLDIHLNGCTANYCETPMLAIYHNNHNGTFADVHAGLLPTTAGQVGAADFDNDGDLDLLADRLYRNNCTVSNTPPTPPLGLVAQLLPDNAVLLTWQPSSDLETASTGLSYDVRVGTTPGGVDYISPPADPVSGYRRVPQRGALNTNRGVLLDVPKGTFYWSVQAVDPSFAGSTFSASGTFTITNARPLISPIANQLTVPGRATPAIPFTVSDVETPATQLTLTRLSLNPSLVPTANIVFSGSDSNRTVTLTPLAGVSGTANIVVGVMDAQGLVATSRFDVVVQAFTEVSVGLPTTTVTAGASAWGDYDNDGHLDIALCGSGLNNTTIYRNTNGLFVLQNFNLPNRTDSDLVWLDYDKDGDLDLLECGWSGGYTPTNFVFRNNFVANSFTVGTMAVLTNIATGTMAWGDYDNDGALDLYLSGDPNTYHTPDAFGLLYHNDHGVLTNSGVALPSVVKGAAVWGDFDNDGDLDLLIAGQTGSTATTAITKLFRNDGNGVFTEMPVGFPGVTDCSVAWGDFDNDGRLDLALAGMGTNSVPVTRIYRNLGNGVFTNLNVNLVGVSLASVAWGDYDNDGFLDLAVSGSTNGYTSGGLTKVYHNNAGASFTDMGGSLPGVAGQTLCWGDNDNDGDLDLLVGTHLCRNNWDIPNTPPGAPTNLLSSIEPLNSVLLKWSVPADRETTNSRGLSYTLRMGTSPGGAQIISPHSDPASGYRRVPQSGNAGQSGAWRIYNLTNGTYYWSVQAVDSALAGSAFAAEASFVVSRPAISVITNRSTPPNTMVGPIAFTVSDAQTAASNLVVAASASDTNLVPVSGLVLAGTDTNRTLTITPAANRSGVTTITLVATNETGQAASRSFVLTVERFGDIGAGLLASGGPVIWGDFDNDGDVDLAAGPFVYRNDGNNTFTLLSQRIPYNEGFGAFNDYDRDGNLDLVAVGANGIIVYRGTGDGAFTNINAGLPGANGLHQCAAWGDFDNDGDPDLVLTTPSVTRIYRNNGTNFTDIAAGLPVVTSGAAAWGDFDNDGDLDLLLAGNNLMRLYRNNGNGTFTDTAAGFPGIYVSSVAWGDYDNDGYLDFVVAGSTNLASSGAVTRLYHNIAGSGGARVFTNVYALSPGIWKGAVAWGDYDNDGDLDLLVTGETTNFQPFTKLYRNDNGNLVDSGLTLPALKSSYAVWADYDGDGALDLALSGLDAMNAPVARIYRNFANGVTNRVPAAPVSLANSVTRKTVRLSWTAPADPNQATGLSYNLRVGTSPGAGDIVSPLSGAGGVRKVVALGNVNERQSWTLNNLTGGTFYWSVQAVDHAFAGSPFAAEGSFVVANVPPVAAAQSITLPEDTSAGVSLSGSDADGDSLTFNVATPPLFGTLSGTPPNVTYTPKPNFFGYDLFTYLANDRTTDSALAQVVLEVTPVADVTNATLGIQSPTGGPMQLTLAAEPWNKYRIEASEDLVHWVPLTNVVPTNLLCQLVDADAARFDHRFYRSAWVPCEAVFAPASSMDTQGFHFNLTGETGRVYQVRYSSDLSTWTPLVTLVLTNSPIAVSDPTATNAPQRFYRVVGP
jgi:hypothetical protein